MSAEKRQALEDKMATGEYDRRRLIRFGYLSEVERRRLIATYPDLEARFEPEPEYGHTSDHALFIYIALLFGMALGFGHTGVEGFIGFRAVWPYISTSIIYWALAYWVLRNVAKEKQERTERYWEWRGYKCDKYGRKNG